jgi:hypothetical protein
MKLSCEFTPGKSVYGKDATNRPHVANSEALDIADACKVYSSIYYLNERSQAALTVRKTSLADLFGCDHRNGYGRSFRDRYRSASRSDL